MKTILTGRRGLGVLVLAAGALIAPFGTGNAFAHSAVCRTDPLFQFNNSLGQSHKDQISFSLSNDTTTYNEITTVHYEVHVPSNTTTYTVSDPTSDPYYGKSTWTVYKDMPSGEWKVIGTVSASVNSIPVTLNQQVVLNCSKNCGSSVKAAVNGYSNQALTIDQTNVL